MKKSEIIEAIITEQKKVVENLERAKEIYRKSSDIDEEDTIDPEDLSHQVESKEMQLRLENKLSRQRNVIENLEKYKTESFDEIQSGALVETENMYIYIGDVGHNVEVNGKDAICVSHKAPIMKSLLSAKIGDEISIGEHKHTIIDIL